MKRSPLAVFVRAGTSNHNDISAVQNSNFQQSIYTLNIDIKQLCVPQEPKTLRESLRRARMDKNMLIRELAEQIRVTEDTVINWEIRGMKPNKRYLPLIQNFIES